MNDRRQPEIVVKNGKAYRVVGSLGQRKRIRSGEFSERKQERRQDDRRKAERRSA